LQIEERQVGPRALDHFDRFPAVFGLADQRNVFEAAQHRGEKRTRGALVVGYHNAQ